MQPHLAHVTSKIKNLARSGHITCARKLFDEMPQRDCITWNAMLSSYTQLNHHQEAFSLFLNLRTSQLKPDHFTFTSTLSAIAALKDSQNGQKVHTLIILSGYCSSLPVNNALIDMYGKCLSPYDAKKVFNEMGFIKNEVSWCSVLFAYVSVNEFLTARGFLNLMPKKTVIAWNTLIIGYAQNKEVKLCFETFKEMLMDSCKPDQWTLSSIMSSCAESRDFNHGYMLHSFIIKSGWNKAIEVNNSILSYYTKFNCQKEVFKVIERIEIFNQISLNAIIDSHMKIGNIQEAFSTFQQSDKNNIISWTCMINGFSGNGFSEDSISFFIKMFRNGIKPDDITFGGVLHACSNLTSLSHGSMIHSCVFKLGFHIYPYVGNGLVNMYSKCGDLGNSYKAFLDIIKKDLISWNTMIFGFGLHGLGKEALEIFNEMLVSSIKPDKVTFIGLLMSCSHTGLIEQGKVLFEEMSDIYGVSLEIDHVSCMIDILGRGGYLEEAKGLAKKYNLYEGLFGACFVHGNVEIGEESGDLVKVMKPRNEMSYVLLSNLYCVSGKWKESENLRKKMMDLGVSKIVGISWIELSNGNVSFVAGDKLYLNNVELCKIINVLESEMRYPIAL